MTFTAATSMHRQSTGYTRLWVAAAVLSAMAACSASVQPSPPDDRVCAGTVCLSPSVMTGQVRQLLDGQVVGYVALIGDRVAAAGAARKDTDPPGHPMGADVVANTASVGKMFTTVVVLKALAERGLGPDAAIGPYLPPEWARGPNTESITFRELLTHRSGFRLDNARIFTSDTAGREQIAAGVKAADKAAPEYNNINFSIIRDLLPRLDRATRGSPNSWFLDRVQHDVFDPVGVHGAQCATPVEPMLYYPPVPGPAGAGQIPPVGPAACASGGWFMTPREMLQVLRGLDNGAILAAGPKRAMDEGCLGWDRCPTSTTSHWKGGDWETRAPSLKPISARSWACRWWPS